MYKTKITEILNIKYPIIEGGMVWAGGKELALAVSQNGGLGTIAGGSCLSEQDLQNKIDFVKKHTDKPFAVNIPMIYPHADMLADISLRNKVPVVITSAGNPKKYTKTLKDAGIKVIHVVANEKFALKAQEAGVDIIVAEGVEAGGHNGQDELTTLVLITNIAKRVKIPVVAAGGIATGEQILAMFALGASGVQLGTLFATSKESSSHINYKNAIINSNDNSTVLTGRRLAPVRALKNDFSNKVLSWEYSDITNEELMKKIGHGGSYKGIIEGDIVNGTPLAGQSSALIHKLLSVEEIFNKLNKEFENGVKNIKFLWFFAKHSI